MITVYLHDKYHPEISKEYFIKLILGNIGMRVLSDTLICIATEYYYNNYPNKIIIENYSQIKNIIAALLQQGMYYSTKNYTEKIINYLDIRNIYIRSGVASLLKLMVGIEVASRWLCSSVSSKIVAHMTVENIDNIIEKYSTRIENALKTARKPE